MKDQATALFVFCHTSRIVTGFSKQEFQVMERKLDGFPERDADEVAGGQVVLEESEGFAEHTLHAVAFGRVSEGPADGDSEAGMVEVVVGPEDGQAFELESAAGGEHAVELACPRQPHRLSEFVSPGFQHGLVRARLPRYYIR